jgi:DNA recombination protein Rad52
MTFTATQVELLSRKLDAKHVKQRDGAAGRKLNYIEYWWTVSEANRIFGYDGWSRETVEMRQISEKPIIYLARVRITAGGVIREGTGAGMGIGSDIGQSHEKAAKEAESDACKRALSTFGSQFGLALYDKEMEGVTNSDDVDNQYNGAKPPPTVDKKSKLDILAVKRFFEFEAAKGMKSLESAWKSVTPEARLVMQDHLEDWKAKAIEADLIITEGKKA